MAPCEYSNREMAPRDVLVTNGDHTRQCRASIDVDCNSLGGIPSQITGFLDLPKSEWEPLANSDRLVLTLRENGEPYRIILDAGTGRFIARQL